MNIDISENALWGIFWTGVFCFLTAVALTIHYSGLHTDNLVAQLITEDGIDPIDASCAIRGTSSEVCKIREIQNLDGLLRYVAQPTSN